MSCYPYDMSSPTNIPSDNRQRIRTLALFNIIMNAQDIELGDRLKPSKDSSSSLLPPLHTCRCAEEGRAPNLVKIPFSATITNKLQCSRFWFGSQTRYRSTGLEKLGPMSPWPIIIPLMFSEETTKDLDRMTSEGGEQLSVFIKNQKLSAAEETWWKELLDHKLRFRLRERKYVVLKDETGVGRDQVQSGQEENLPQG
ncbi:hypothetical protein CONLIGDRAFT_720086 [Coniochaeta ligniaria NRRL 30616]|uniref:Uncharacterized protein n=1 Tax=Coniochaeta ligniaria NRRL 30616 TaxID=1408157 RepID=A0A1J7I3J5_9PEZI|nr:hypothetical protein CONLIGDRAFT_720086 [Coniochaeta ligniaria NRRL 30616]